MIVFFRLTNKKTKIEKNLQKMLVQKKSLC